MVFVLSYVKFGLYLYIESLYFSGSTSHQLRLGQSRPGGFNSLDDDLLMGRYSSGPPSSAASSSRGEMSTWTKAISRALEPALSSLVFNENDRVHLIQCMVADGFAPCLTQQFKKWVHSFND